MEHSERHIFRHVYPAGSKSAKSSLFQPKTQRTKNFTKKPENRTRNCKSFKDTDAPLTLGGGS
jgi:hypothetical protein